MASRTSVFIVPNAVIGDRRGNGIQLEQPAAVRADDEQRATVVRAVAAFYPELVWGVHTVARGGP